MEKNDQRIKKSAYFVLLATLALAAILVFAAFCFPSMEADASTSSSVISEGVYFLKNVSTGNILYDPFVEGVGSSILYREGDDSYIIRPMNNNLLVCAPDAGLDVHRTGSTTDEALATSYAWKIIPTEDGYYRLSASTGTYANQYMCHPSSSTYPIWKSTAQSDQSDK